MVCGSQPSARDILAQQGAAENDENLDKRVNAKTVDAKGLASLAGTAAAARRSVLGDRSNVMNPTATTTAAATGLGVRNLRSTTLESSMMVRSKATAGPGRGIVERTSCLGPAEGKTALHEHNKENAVPRTNLLAFVPPPPVAPTAPPEPSKPRDWDDLDAEDHEDPLMVSEYVAEIFDYMRSLEPQILPQPDYMDTQKELNWHSRSVLIDWLIEVQWKLKLLPETLFLSVNIIDRFLSKRSVSLVKLQLVGMTATLLASKYEEVLSPSIANFVYLADNAYDEQELLKAERYMLHVLNFSLAFPSPLVFLRRISKAEDYDVRSRTLAKYLMEVCMLDHRFVACPPSMMAAVSIYLARTMLKSGLWTPNLRHYSGEYSEADVQPWAEMLLDFLKKPIVYESVFKKYALKKMMKASLFVQEYMKRIYNVPPHTLRDNGRSVFTA